MHIDPNAASSAGRCIEMDFFVDGIAITTADRQYRLCDLSSQGGLAGALDEHLPHDQ